MVRSWSEERDDLCSRLENDLHIGPIQNRDNFIAALVSNTVINEIEDFHSHQKIDCQKGLATLGDTVIDYIILDHFRNPSSSPMQLNEHRVRYGKNEKLHGFALKWLHLEDYVIWADNDRKNNCWETGHVCLATFFEALVAAIYLDHGVEFVKRFFETEEFFSRIDDSYIAAS
jgi:dsRNA-specific ribonuclease